jgi:hypothetical protein
VSPEDDTPALPLSTIPDGAIITQMVGCGDGVAEIVIDRVSDGLAGIDGLAGTAVPLTDAASLPTLISMPQAWGSVSVAE